MGEKREQVDANTADKRRQPRDSKGRFAESRAKDQGGAAEPDDAPVADHRDVEDRHH